MTVDEQTAFELAVDNSPLFQLTDKNSSRYQAESKKLTGLLYSHYFAEQLAQVENACEDIEAIPNLEFFETVEACLKSFNPENGCFHIYFDKAWNGRKKSVKGKVEQDRKYGGTGYTDTDYRNIKNYLRAESKILAQYGDIPRNEMVSRIAKAMNYTEKTVREIFVKIQMSKCSTVKQDEDGEECCVIDDDCYTLWLEDQVIDAENDSTEKATRILRMIEQVYNSQQKRTQVILADLLTADLAKFFATTGIDPTVYAFFNQDVYSTWLQNKAEITHREIADKYGKKESSVSRTWNDFIEKIYPMFAAEKKVR